MKMKEQKIWLFIDIFPFQLPNSDNTHQPKEIHMNWIEYYNYESSIMVENQQINEFWNAREIIFMMNENLGKCRCSI